VAIDTAVRACDDPPRGGRVRLRGPTRRPREGRPLPLPAHPPDGGDDPHRREPLRRHPDGERPRQRCHLAADGLGSRSCARCRVTRGIGAPGSRPRPGTHAGPSPLGIGDDRTWSGRPGPAVGVCRVPPGGADTNNFIQSRDVHVRSRWPTLRRLPTVFRLPRPSKRPFVVDGRPVDPSRREASSRRCRPSRGSPRPRGSTDPSKFRLRDGLGGL
jgi:hypothetical protein